MLQFGQFVGKWNVISMNSTSFGWRESNSSLTFKYTLDGFAIEDIWVKKLSNSANNTMISSITATII